MLADRGIDFEYTHDLRRLIELVEELDINFPFNTGEIVMYTEFAVPLRYEDLLDSEPFDRGAAVTLISEVEAWARGLLDRKDG